MEKNFTILLKKLNSQRNFRSIIASKKELFFNKYKDFDNREIFFELLYCLLTIQNKFFLAGNAIKFLKEAFHFEDLFIRDDDQIFLDKIKDVLRNNSIRFYNNKAKYFLHARNLFWKNTFDSFEFLKNNDVSVLEKRIWLKNNIKGFGLKESTHFLRNIGIGIDLAILDRHVLRSLKMLHVIKNIPNNLSDKKYLEFEKKLIFFARKNNIEMFDIDFLLFIFGKTRNLSFDLLNEQILIDLK